MNRPHVRLWLGALLSAILMHVYVRGGWAWPLGFVMLVPWLLSQTGSLSWRQTLLSGWLMSVGGTAAAFHWFGFAIADYTHSNPWLCLLGLLVVAPLFQPQYLLVACFRRWAAARVSVWLLGVWTALAWLAIEWWVPRVFDDSLGYALYPSVLLRQVADLGGVAALSLLLLVANEAIVLAWRLRGSGVRRMLCPLVVAVGLILLAAAYGWSRVQVHGVEPTEGETVRVGIVQSGIVDYDGLRERLGPADAVRKILDTHYAMSYDAVERHKVDAVLWTETAYPTTFGRPKSEAGAEFDAEIREIVRSAGVPFVFGTYDADDEGEYNAAAFVSPKGDVLGFYRKTRLFPISESVPGWLESTGLRGLLPWAGTWKAGNGPRVFPLQMSGDRELPVLPLICLDDVDSQLVIDGARLGARAILSMSNDSWFTQQSLGAALHQQVAAIRSIETRLPQFRVTSNGHSAVIDASGALRDSSAMGQQVLMVGQLKLGEPPQTLMMAWGNWVGRAATGALLIWGVLLLGGAWHRRVQRLEQQDAAEFDAQAEAGALPAQVHLLPVAARVVAGALRGAARLGLLWMGVAFLFGIGTMSVNRLAELRGFAAMVLAPELLAWLVLKAFAARASVQDGRLVFSRGRAQISLALADIAAAKSWRFMLPGRGLTLGLAGGQAWRYGVMHRDPVALARVLQRAGAVLATEAPVRRATAPSWSLLALRRSVWDRAWLKFGLFPLVMTVPAFILNQNIAYGSPTGELDFFGWQAYAIAFGLWWSTWTVDVMIYASLLRLMQELGTGLAALVRPSWALPTRQNLRRLSHLLLYVGMPAWLAMRMFGN